MERETVKIVEKLSDPFVGRAVMICLPVKYYIAFYIDFVRVRGNMNSTEEGHFSAKGDIAISIVYIIEARAGTVRLVYHEGEMSR